MGKKVVTFRIEEEDLDYYKRKAREISYYNHQDITLTDMIKLGLANTFNYFGSGTTTTSFHWASGFLNG